MPIEYRIDIKDPAGVIQAVVTDYLELSYSKQVNHPGLLTFAINGDHPAFSLLSHKSQVEVWRRNTAMSVPWYCDFYGLYLGLGREFTNKDTAYISCPGQMWFLSTRRIAWYAGTLDRSKFTTDPAETVMKTLVNYNACAAATVVNGRIRDGAITGLSIEADGANGNTVDWFCSYDNLLESLQKLADIAGGDFDLVKTGAQAWEFRWYTGQLGTDRSATVKFALLLGNMALPRYERDRVEEKTVAIVGGQGEEAARTVVVRTGPDYAADNNVETFVDARDVSTAAGLNSRGDRELEGTRATEDFSFSVLQTPSCYYGRHYFLGDLVTVNRWFDNTDVAQKIDSINVAFNQNGEETIDIGMKTP